MPDSKDLEETLDQLAKQVEDTGDEVLETHVPDLIEVTVRNNEDYSMHGHRCRTGQNHYYIAGHPDLRFVAVVYFLSIRDNIAQDLEHEIAEGIVEQEYEDDIDLHLKAADALLEKVPRSDMDTFESYSYQFIAGGPYETTLEKDESGNVVLMAVGREIFPYEPSYGISDLYESVQTVVSVGERGMRLIGRTIYLDVDHESPNNTELKFNYNW